MAGERASVLCVCEGNICRSPTMELYLRRAWGDDVAVSSAGTYAMEGWELPRETLTVLEQEGLDGSEHDPLQINDALIADADLILVAALDQWNWIVKRNPDAASKTFLVTEVAALTRVVPAGKAATRAQRIKEATPILASARSALAGRKHEDILDPYGLSAAKNLESTRQIKSALDALLGWLGA